MHDLASTCLSHLITQLLSLIHYVQAQGTSWCSKTQSLSYLGPLDLPFPLFGMLFS